MDANNILDFNKPLFENMSFFADAVWLIDIKKMTVYTFIDKLEPSNNGTEIPLEKMHRNLSAKGHSESVNKIKSYYTKGFIQSLKESFAYENQMSIGGKNHTLQCVMTPIVGGDGEVAGCYVTTRDIQDIIDAKESSAKARQEELTSIADVLYNANIGLWNFVVRDGAPRLYADSSSAEIIGVQSEQRADDNYLNWSERIVPEYMDSVLDAIEKMLCGNPAEVIYPYEHPSLGRRTLRMGGVLNNKYEGKGVCLRGYIQDISDYNEKLFREIELSNALLSYYHSVLSLDTLSGMAKVLWDPESIYGEEKNDEGMIRLDFTKFEFDITPETIKSFRDIKTAEGIRKTLKGKKILSLEFESAARGWFRMSIIPSYRNREGDADRCVILTEYIDDVKKEELKRTQLLKEAMEKEKSEQETLKSIASVYLTTHLIDFKERTIKEITALKHIHKYVEEHDSDDIQYVIWGIMRERVCVAHRDRIVDFTDFSTLQKRLGGKCDISIEVLNVDDQWLKFSFVRVENDRGSLDKVIYTCQLVDDIKRKEESLVLMLNTDALTGLYSRHAYEEVVTELGEKGIPRNLWYIGFDVNGLKGANDTKGHKAGDELIVGAAGVISSAISSLGKVYRIGGDEFIAILYGNEIEVEECLALMEENRKKWKGIYLSELSFSKGVVSAKEFPGCSISDLEKESDRRMYSEKRAYYTSIYGDRRKN